MERKFVVYSLDAQDRVHVVSVHQTEDDAMNACDLMTQLVAPVPADATDIDAAVQEYSDQH